MDTTTNNTNTHTTNEITYKDITHNTNTVSHTSQPARHREDTEMGGGTEGRRDLATCSEISPYDKTDLHTTQQHMSWVSICM